MLYRYLSEVEFAHPEMLLLLPVCLLWMRWHSRRAPAAAMTVSSSGSFGRSAGLRTRLLTLPAIFRLLALCCLVAALARPQSHHSERRVTGEGIDIMLCIDVSGSMLAQDLQPNRLEAAKQVATQFILNRPTDRFGVVVFAGESFTLCPLTSDHALVREQIHAVTSGSMTDGTAIGSGLASAADRLRASASASRVVVLLTDGENNGGLVDPASARSIARTLGVKVYTIGVGTDGFAPIPVRTPGGGVEIRREKVSIDEPMLRAIATQTGGAYFRASDNERLRNVYAEIDRMEKTKVDIVTRRETEERFRPLVIAALALLLSEVVLRYLLLRSFP